MSHAPIVKAAKDARPRKMTAERLYAAALHARTRRHIEQPLYYGGKWWAKRLAVVTRWMIESALPRGEAGVILDPFAGSGTTLGEALRLGHRAIGVEISPFAAILARQAFSVRHPELEATYERITDEALEEVTLLYGGNEGPSGYFWAYERACPGCGQDALLLSRRILVQHAYPNRHPTGWALCPHSRDVFPVADVRSDAARCPCGENVTLRATAGLYRCAACNSIISRGGLDAAEASHPPRPVLVAVEDRQGSERLFRAPTPDDLALARSADNLCAPLGAASIERGRSTRQLLDWGYSDWADLFHPRQRELASAITTRIAEIESEMLQTQLALAFSPFFEYHCRLTSFKGLGTGSIRQAFGRPVLHPVSVSFEMNPLFEYRSRINPSGDIRAWYARRTQRSAQAFSELCQERGSDISLGSETEVAQGDVTLAVLCADSSTLSLPNDSVDAIVTDPPFFNRVHYDDLAGGLNAWLRWCGTEAAQSGRGIQSDEGAVFARGAYRAFQPATKALKDGGRVIFTFHHQEIDAWIGLAQALAPLPIAAQGLLLVPSEMPNALIKQRAHAPISCDVVLQLRKEPRRLSLKNAASRASLLALSALQGCPEALAGDRRSAAYGAGLVVGLRSIDAPKDWSAFLAEVESRVDAATQKEAANVLG